MLLSSYKWMFDKQQKHLLKYAFVAKRQHLIQIRYCLL